MYRTHNKTVLDRLAKAKTGHVPYLQARHVVAIEPTPAMTAALPPDAHRGTLHLHNTTANKKLIVVDHVASGRSEFDQAIRDCGYGKWKLQYTN